MKEIKVMPIFNQSAPGVWEEFVRIRGSRFENTDRPYTLVESAGAMKAWRDQWAKYKYNFAFGAYDANHMCGFVQGYVSNSVASIECLYVEPKYQGQGIGRRLLRYAENAAGLITKQGTLTALAPAMSYYPALGWRSPTADNHFEKKFIPTSVATVPVFYSMPGISRACRAISADYDPKLVNNHTMPTFVYRDIGGKIQGVINDAGVFVAKNQPTEFVRRQLNRTYSEYMAHIKSLER